MNEAEAVARYAGMVRSRARRLKNRLVEKVDIDDLIQEGFVGLIGAIRRKMPGRSSREFSSYADQRIRYAMIDYLRREGWMPRWTYHWYKKFKEVRQLLNREPTIEEYAAHLEVPVREVEKWLKVASVQRKISSVNTSEEMNEGYADGKMFALRDPGGQRYDPELFRAVERALLLLGKRDRRIPHILTEHYMKGRPFYKIARDRNISLSDSRVSQLYHKGMRFLREYFQ